MDSHKRLIRKVLIANRGEIAVRVLRTCKRLGIATCIIYTTPDANSPVLALADESYFIGEAQAYLDMDKIIAAAKAVRADAVHPGFGFLSENGEFAQKCEKEGLIFIGPSAYSIGAMGSKSEAKMFLKEKYDNLIPVIPGYHGDDQSVETLTREAIKVGFPVLLKASAGGGGKGMRIVWNTEDLPNAIRSAQREAKESFGSDKLLIERYFSSVRHVEIQIFGDAQANVIHLFERDCSVQRRHQKVIEESPSPAFLKKGEIGDKIREQMGKAAVKIGEAIRYQNAGTVEFILDDKDNFYFLEVNTRLQVEHPVTEMITGLDLVELQIRVAEGYTFAELGISQATLARRGHAIQCRLYAEDPNNDFLPAPGRLIKWLPAEVEGVRYDMGIQSGSEITMHYDPMVAKIIAHGPNRAVALQRMRRALRETMIVGLTTNQQFLLQVLDHPAFINGDYNTHFIQNHLPADARLAWAKAPLPPAAHAEVALVATAFLWEVNQQSLPLQRNVTPGFRNVFFKASQKKFLIDEQETVVEYTMRKKTHKESLADANVTFDATVNGAKHTLFIERPNQNGQIDITHNTRTGHLFARMRIGVDGQRASFTVLAIPNSQGDDLFLHAPHLGKTVKLKAIPTLRPKVAESDGMLGNVVRAAMTGKIVQVNVTPGQEVQAGEPLLIMESMKMETKILAPKAGKIAEVFAKPNVVIDEGSALFSYVAPPAKK